MYKPRLRWTPMNHRFVFIYVRQRDMQSLNLFLISLHQFWFRALDLGSCCISMLFNWTNGGMSIRWVRCVLKWSMIWEQWSKIFGIIKTDSWMQLRKLQLFQIVYISSWNICGKYICLSVIVIVIVVLENILTLNILFTIFSGNLSFYEHAISVIKPVQRVSWDGHFLAPPCHGSSPSQHSQHKKGKIFSPFQSCTPARLIGTYFWRGTVTIVLCHGRKFLLSNLAEITGSRF